MNDRLALVFWDLGHPIVLAGTVAALGTVVLEVGFILASWFVWSNGHGFGSFLE